MIYIAALSLLTLLILAAPIYLFARLVAAIIAAVMTR